MWVIDQRVAVGLKSHDGLFWSITLITAIQSPIQDLCGGQEDASKVTAKVEPGSLCLWKTQIVDWNWTLHTFKGSWSAFTKIKKNGIQQRLSKVLSFCCYHVVSFHISPLCKKICSLEPQFGAVIKQKIFSLPHSRFFHLNNYEHLSFLSFPVSLATCKDTPKKQCQATPSL